MTTRQDIRAFKLNRSASRLSWVTICSLATLWASPHSAFAIPFPTISSATVVAHYDSDITEDTASVVTNWPNQATYGTATTQMELDARPAVFQSDGGPTLMSAPSEINGKPYLRFANTSSTDAIGLQTGTISVADIIPSSSRVTIIHVGRLNSQPMIANEWYDGRTSGTRKAFVHDLASPFEPSLFSGTLAEAPDLDAAPVDGEFHMWVASFDGTSPDIFLDGPTGESLSPTSPGVVTWDGITIGSRHAAESGTIRGIDGDIAELVVLSGALSATDLDAIGTYFEAKFGLDTAFTDPPASSVPEPSTAMLLGLGVLALVRHTRRRRPRA